QLDVTDVEHGYPTTPGLLDLLEYRGLKHAWTDPNGVLSALLVTDASPAPADVAKVAGWDATETQAFLTGWGRTQLDIAGVSRLEEAFRISAITGLSAEALLVAATAISTGGSPAGLDGALATLHGDEWPAVERRLGQRLVIQRRDALAGAAL